MSDLVLNYLIQLSTTLLLPLPIWILAVWRVARLRGFTNANLEERVNESVEETLKEQIK